MTPADRILIEITRQHRLRLQTQPDLTYRVSIAGRGPSNARDVEIVSHMPGQGYVLVRDRDGDEAYFTTESIEAVGVHWSDGSGAA